MDFNNINFIAGAKARTKLQLFSMTANILHNVYHINFFFYPKMLCQINAIKLPYIISILDRSSKLGFWSYFTFGLPLLRVLNPVFRLWIKEPVQELSCLGEIPNVLDFRHQHPLKMHKLNIFFANKVTFVGNKFCKQ